MFRRSIVFDGFCHSMSTDSVRPLNFPQPLWDGLENEHKYQAYRKLCKQVQPTVSLAELYNKAREHLDEYCEDQPAARVLSDSEFVTAFLETLQQLRKVAKESETPEEYTMSVEAFLNVLEGQAAFLFLQDLDEEDDPMDTSDLVAPQAEVAADADKAPAEPPAASPAAASTDKAAAAKSASAVGSTAASGLLAQLTEVFKDDPDKLLQALNSPLVEALQRSFTTHVVRSTAKAHQPDIFHGTAAENGPKALQWVRTFELYAHAENEPNPVSKAATYLRDSAQDWWHSVASVQLPENPSFAAFKALFLNRYVKPSDSAKARVELPQLKQAQKSVEEYATAFREMNSRITVVSPVDTTTLAGWFISGLKREHSQGHAHT